MGLDISHDCFSGAYSAFFRFREYVAKAAGYSVWDVKTSHGLVPTIVLDWGHITEKNLAGKWEKTPDDPLIVLFAHYDDRGCIYPEQALPLSNSLQELLPFLTGSGGGHLESAGGVRQVAINFIKGLRTAALSGEPVTFG